MGTANEEYTDVLNPAVYFAKVEALQAAAAAAAASNPEPEPAPESQAAPAVDPEPEVAPASAPAPEPAQSQDDVPPLNPAAYDAKVEASRAAAAAAAAPEPKVEEPAPVPQEAAPAPAQAQEAQVEGVADPVPALNPTEYLARAEARAAQPEAEPGQAEAPAPKSEAPEPTSEGAPATTPSSLDVTAAVWNPDLKAGVYTLSVEDEERVFRFSAFLRMHAEFSKICTRVPSKPPKKMKLFTDHSSSKFLKDRRRLLDSYFTQLVGSNKPASIIPIIQRLSKRPSS